MNIKNTQGFTLVELLVVMAIIATIAVISVPPLMEHIKSSRDTVRVTHIKQIEQAISTYVISNWDYPKVTSFALLKQTLKNELPKFPIDPRDTKACIGGKCQYTYKSDWVHYMLTTRFETQKNVDNLAKKDWISNVFYNVYDDLTKSQALTDTEVIITNAP